MDSAPGWVPLLIARPLLTTQLRSDKPVVNPLVRTFVQAYNEHSSCSSISHIHPVALTERCDSWLPVLWLSKSLVKYLIGLEKHLIAQKELRTYDPAFEM
jgi:hypothetical protein